MASSNESMFVKLHQIQLNWELEKKAILKRWSEEHREWVEEKQQLLSRIAQLKDLFNHERYALLKELTRVVQDKSFLQDQIKELHRKEAETSGDTLDWSSKKQREQKSLFEELDQLRALMRTERQQGENDRQEAKAARLKMEDLTRQVKRLTRENQDLKEESVEHRKLVTDLLDENRRVRTELGVTQTNREDVKLLNSKLRILSEFVQSKEQENQQLIEENRRLRVES